MDSVRPPLTQEFYPEQAVGGFTHVDVRVEFYNRIASILKETDHVLDYGAGRGGDIDEDKVPFRRRLVTLKNRCAHVEGCDIDQVVLTNPYIDHATVISPTGALPFADGEFDLIVCNWVFEHVVDTENAATELMRILKPGGYLCAMTPNKWGYISVASRIFGNANHARWLKHAQPTRLEVDMFPTIYGLNTHKAIKRHFGKYSTTVVYQPPSLPAYYFGKRSLFRLFQLFHALTPPVFRPVLLVFLQKHR